MRFSPTAVQELMILVMYIHCSNSKDITQRNNFLQLHENFLSPPMPIPSLVMVD